MKLFKKKQYVADPSFLFSTWPIPTWSNDRCCYVVLSPSDTEWKEAAANRLDALGGGILRLTPGEYTWNTPMYLDDSIAVIGEAE